MPNIKSNVVDGEIYLLNNKNMVYTRGDRYTYICIYIYALISYRNIEEIHLVMTINKSMLIIKYHRYIYIYIYIYTLID